MTLVLGGAGTGKTTAALWAARTAIEQGEVLPHQKVLFLTFSRTAVNQIAARSSGVLDGIQDRVELSTFHSFGLRMLLDFGRYLGLSQESPVMQSVAQRKLLGPDEGSWTYDDLVPTAVRIVGSRMVNPLVAERWPLVICDEFQDIDPSQWELLEQLSHHCRLVLLADPNQMIYTFVPGVGPGRLQTARNRAQEVIQLKPSSYRDPSGFIPAMAEAIRERKFLSKEVRSAVAEHRLSIHKQIPDDSVIELLGKELVIAKEKGLESTGIFAHSNEGVARLSVALTENGIDHSLVGLSEAQGEALKAISVLLMYGVGLADNHAVDLALGTFLTACTRGREAPGIARGLAFGLPDLPSEF